MKKELIKVAMADDHILLRNALASLINNSGDCSVVYECSNGNELISKIKTGTKPDVVILDLNMPEMDGHDESFPQLITFETRISHVFSAFWTNEGKVSFKPLLLSSKNATGGLYPSEL